MTTSSFLQETQPTLTLKDVVLSRQNSFLSWLLRICEGFEVEQCHGISKDFMDSSGKGFTFWRFGSIDGVFCMEDEL